MAHKNRLSTWPISVVELGPGGSLGTGLAALLSGADEYYAFDVVEYMAIEDNIKVFDLLVDLFMNPEKIPDETEFPKLQPRLDAYEFPFYILDKERLGCA